MTSMYNSAELFYDTLRSDIENLDIKDQIDLLENFEELIHNHIEYLKGQLR